MAHRFLPVRLAPASLGVPAHLFREDGVTRPTGQQLYEVLHLPAAQRPLTELEAAAALADNGPALRKVR